MYYYKAYGLSLKSELPLPELTLDRDNRTVDYTIRMGKVPLSPIRKRFRDRVILSTGEGFIFYWKKLGTFLIGKDKNIVVDSHPAADGTKYINALLIGPILGMASMLCDRYCVFHAAVVARNNEGAIGLLARSGQGKSTTASALINKGYSLVSDDLLVMEMTERPVVQPGYPGMKLWGETVEQYVTPEENLSMIGREGEYEKKIRPLRHRFLDKPISLDGLFILEFDNNLEQPQIQKLTKKEALLNLLPHWYGSLYSGDLLPFMEKDRLFSECSRLAGKTPVYRVTRPADMSLIDKTLDKIETVF